VGLRCYLPAAPSAFSTGDRAQPLDRAERRASRLEFGRIFGGLPELDVGGVHASGFHERRAGERRFLGGLPPPPFQSAPPPVTQSVVSLKPVNFIDAKRTQQRTMSFPEFAQLPDHAYSLWDWALGNETCPLGDSTPAVACHEFKTHMGPVNSNHFAPQSAFFYEYYHDLALARAADCKKMITKLGDARARFADSVACGREALVLEAVGQHFLQDAWAWVRGSAGLAGHRRLPIAHPSPPPQSSGLIHGARGARGSADGGGRLRHDRVPLRRSAECA
jgi:hypothetical protein